MAKRAGAETATSPVTVVAGEHVTIPRPSPPAEVRGQAVGAIMEAGAGSERILTGVQAAPKRMGAAFAAWCREQGINPEQRRRAADWQPIVDRFLKAPTPGHRNRRK